MNEPKLRFEEFRGSGEWEETTLEHRAEYVNGKAHENEISESGNFIVANSKFISSNGEVRKFTNNGLCLADQGDILMVLSDVPNGKAIAKCFYVDKNNTYSVNQRICKLKPKNTVGLFLFNILNRNSYFLSFDDGVKQTNLRNEDVLNCPILLPIDLDEQQKIASCLSSIDELISAETQKLEALKSHKKGLMQQLFPAEGETLPKLRFEEFRGSGEWEVMKLGELCKFIRGPFGGALKKEIFVADGYAVYEQYHAIYNDFNSIRYYITKEKYSELKRFSVLPGDIIMSCSGTMGKFAIVPAKPKEGVINQALLKLTVKEGSDIDFIKTTLELPVNQEKLLSQAAGGAIKNVVEVALLKEITVSMPSLKEQHKISSFLSSLNELIDEQSDKIKMLHKHKKGLMQGLFPNTNSL